MMMHFIVLFWEAILRFDFFINSRKLNGDMTFIHQTHETF